MGLEKVKDFLSDYHIVVKDDWVSQAIQVCKDYGCNTSLKQLCASVLDLFLNSDLLESYVAPMKIPSVAVKVVLTKPIIFQITSVFDISRPLYEQFCELTFHKDDLSWFHGDDNENDATDIPRSSHTRKRILKLSLFDGTNMISGLEFGSLQCVPSDVRLGAKIILTARVVCRKGVMLLNDSNCQLLGGDIEGCNVITDPAQKYADRLGIEYSNGKRAPSLKAPDAFAPARPKSKTSKAADVSNISNNGNSTLSPFLVKIPRRGQPSELDSTSCSEAGLVQQPLRMTEYPYTNRIPLKSTNPSDRTTELSSCSALVSSLGSPESSSKSFVSNTSVLGSAAENLIQSCTKQKISRKDISERTNGTCTLDKSAVNGNEETYSKSYETVLPPKPPRSSIQIPTMKKEFNIISQRKSCDSTAPVSKKTVPLNYCAPTYNHTDSSSNVSPQDSNPSYSFPSPKRTPVQDHGPTFKQQSIVPPFKPHIEKAFEHSLDSSSIYSRGIISAADNNNNHISSSNNSNDDLVESLNIVESPNTSSHRLSFTRSADLTNSSTESFIPPMVLQKQLRLPPLAKSNPPMHYKHPTGSPRKADMITSASNSFVVPEKRVRTEMLSVVNPSAARELHSTKVFSDEEPDKSIALQDTLSDPKITMIEKFKRLNIALLQTSLRNKAYWMLPKVVSIQGICHVPTDLKARNGHWVLHIHVSDESTERLYCEVSPILLDRMLGFTVQSCQDPIVIRNKAEMQRRKVRALSVAHSLLRLDLILSIEMYPERDSVPLILDVKTISETLNIVT